MARAGARVDTQPLVDGLLIVGDFGSGKTEVAVNLALDLAAARGPRPIALADLDLVNPYFRCREVHAPLEAAGVRVVVPPGEQEFADLPILLPAVKARQASQAPTSVVPWVSQSGSRSSATRSTVAAAPADSTVTTSLPATQPVSVCPVSLQHAVSTQVPRCSVPKQPRRSTRTPSASSMHSGSRSRQLQRAFKPIQDTNDRSHVPPVQDCYRAVA